MKKRPNQERILSSLLESSKTTGQLAYELNYVDPDGTVHYSIIYDDLQKLVKSGYILGTKEKLEKKPGGIPTWYSINYSIKNLKKILEEYSDLIGKMQENKKVLEIIIHTHPELLSNTNEEEYMEKVPNFKSLYKKGIEGWNAKLKLSREFFRLFLNNETNDLEEIIGRLSQISGDDWYTISWLIKKSATESVFVYVTNYKIDMAFKACVASDILHRQSNEEAMEYVKKLENEVSAEQFEQLTKCYKNIKVAPEYLREKKLIPVENPKLQEIEQKYIDSGGKFV